MKAKRKTMKDKVLEMHTANPKMSAVEIAKALNIKTAYVHQIKYLEKKQQKDQAENKVASDPVASLLNTLREEAKNLAATIAYLERRAGV